MNHLLQKSLQNTRAIGSVGGISQWDDVRSRLLVSIATRSTCIEDFCISFSSRVQTRDTLYSYPYCRFNEWHWLWLVVFVFVGVVIMQWMLLTRNFRVWYDENARHRRHGYIIECDMKYREKLHSDFLLFRQSISFSPSRTWPAIFVMILKPKIGNPLKSSPPTCWTKPNTSAIITIFNFTSNTTPFWQKFTELFPLIKNKFDKTIAVDWLLYRTSPNGPRLIWVRRYETAGKHHFW